MASCFENGKARIVPGDLTCEYLENPLAVDAVQPRLSWINTASRRDRGQYQTAYQIQVASSAEILNSGNPDIWDTGKVESDRSFLVKYDGPSTESRKQYYWRVKVWDKEGCESSWSEMAIWGMGLLDAFEWQASWIGVPWQGEEPLPDLNPRPENAELPPPAPLLRKSQGGFMFQI
jgi:alpha-L-rhamnosidase